MQRKPRTTKLPQLSSNIGTHNMHNVHEELIKRQGNHLEREYYMLDAGTPACVQNYRGENGNQP